jgi:pyruvate kinase
MNVARLDFSTGDHKSHGMEIANLQSALKQRPDRTVAIMLDTKGPEIRTGVLREGKPAVFEVGQSVEIFTDYAIEGDDTRLACNYKNLTQAVTVGSTVCVGELMSAEVTEVSEVSMFLRSMSSFNLSQTSSSCLVKDRKDFDC